jgi:hypothetical protein
MFTIRLTGKVGAVSSRYETAAEALNAYRQLAGEDITHITITDHRIDEEIALATLEGEAASAPLAVNGDQPPAA